MREKDEKERERKSRMELNVEGGCVEGALGVNTSTGITDFDC